MSTMRARDDEAVTFTPDGDAALDRYADALAASYDGTEASLDRLMAALATTDVEDLALDVSVASSEMVSVDEVAQRRLATEQARTIPDVGADRPAAPAYGW